MNTLMEHLNFTPDDLANNRQKTLSATQQETLNRQKTRVLMIGGAIFWGLAVVATIFLYIGQRENSLIMGGVGAIVTLCNATLIGLFARHWMRLNADLRSGAVVSVSGTLERIIRAYGRANNFVVGIQDQRFSVNKETFKAFKHNHPYTLYYTRHTHTLLSAE